MDQNYSSTKKNIFSTIFLSLNAKKNFHIQVIKCLILMAFSRVSTTHQYWRGPKQICKRYFIWWFYSKIIFSSFLWDL